MHCRLHCVEGEASGMLVQGEGAIATRSAVRGWQVKERRQTYGMRTETHAREGFFFFPNLQTHTYSLAARERPCI